MTTKTELVELAKQKYVETNPAIRCLITAITEAQNQQIAARMFMSRNAEILSNAFTHEPYTTYVDENVMRHTTDFVASAAKLNTLLMTLACALEACGEKIEY